jgi:hypothetical protein
MSSLQDDPSLILQYSLWLNIHSRSHKFQADVMLEEFTFATPCGISGRSARRSPTGVKRSLEEVHVYVLSLGHCVDPKIGLLIQRCLALGTSPIDSASYERLGLLKNFRSTSWEWEEFIKETAYQTVTIN